MKYIVCRNNDEYVDEYGNPILSIKKFVMKLIRLTI